MGQETTRRVRNNLIKLAVLSLLTQAFSLIAAPELAMVDHAGKASPNRNSSQRSVSREWNPHSMIASLLERTNGPHKQNWSQEPDDFFESEFKVLKARIERLASNGFDPSELSSIDARTERVAKAITTILDRTKAIKEEVKLDEPDSVGKLKRADSLITALQFHLQTIDSLRELIQKTKERPAK